MDWLWERQRTIEKKLAVRHVGADDRTSSYFDGTTCPLTRRGYNRDGKHGTLQVSCSPARTRSVSL